MHRALSVKVDPCDDQPTSGHYAPHATREEPSPVCRSLDSGALIAADPLGNDASSFALALHASESSPPSVRIGIVQINTMPNASTQFYLALNGDARAVIELSTADSAQLGRVQQEIDDLDCWCKVLAVRPESVALQNALREATVGLFLLASGLYRSAFVSLRLFLELSLASVHFSVNRLELAEWLRGTRDVNWGALIDGDEGVLSIRYASAFFPELRDSIRTYNAIGSKAYRELSEFVHGNHHTLGDVNGRIAFNAELQTQWLDLFESASTVVGYSLCLRFLKELPRTDLGTLAPNVGAALGHIEAVRDYLRIPS